MTPFVVPVVLKTLDTNYTSCVDHPNKCTNSLIHKRFDWLACCASRRGFYFSTRYINCPVLVWWGCMQVPLKLVVLSCQSYVAANYQGPVATRAGSLPKDLFLEQELGTCSTGTIKSLLPESLICCCVMDRRFACTRTPFLFHKVGLGKCTCCCISFL